MYIYTYMYIPSTASKKIDKREIILKIVKNYNISIYFLSLIKYKCKKIIPLIKYEPTFWGARWRKRKL